MSDQVCKITTAAQSVAKCHKGQRLAVHNCGPNNDYKKMEPPCGSVTRRRPAWFESADMFGRISCPVRKSHPLRRPVSFRSPRDKQTNCQFLNFRLMTRLSEPSRTKGFADEQVLQFGEAAARRRRATEDTKLLLQSFALLAALMGLLHKSNPITEHWLLLKKGTTLLQHWSMIHYLS